MSGHQDVDLAYSWVLAHTPSRDAVFLAPEPLFSTNERHRPEDLAFSTGAFPNLSFSTDARVNRYFLPPHTLGCHDLVT